jgi:hypothetical protein
MLGIPHMKEHMPSVVSILIFPKQVGGTFLRAGSHGFGLGRKGYSVFIVVSMPPCSSFIHSFILF